MKNKVYNFFLETIPTSRHFSNKNIENFEPLKADASNRLYFKFKVENEDYILQYGPDKIENLSFLNIANFLFFNNHKIPKIIEFDLEKNITVLNYLSDIHLTDISENKSYYYFKAIDNLIKLHKTNLKYFNLNWCFQSKTYNNELVLEKEILYFFKNFINNYLKLTINSEEIRNTINKEIEILSYSSTKNTHPVLMHRDYQSKNIMVKKTDVFFIDWQSTRLGPKEYDLASLLIDPYVNLSEKEQEEYLNYYLIGMKINNKNNFMLNFKQVAANRLMQALGAYSRYTIEGIKKQFEQYIPTAIKRLSTIIDDEIFEPYPNLKAIIKESEKEVNTKCVL